MDKGPYFYIFHLDYFEGVSKVSTSSIEDVYDEGCIWNLMNLN